MATVVGVVCVWRVAWLKEHVMQIQPKGDLLTETIFTGC